MAKSSREANSKYLPVAYYTLFASFGLIVSLVGT
jgi:hypothetical protein